MTPAMTPVRTAASAASGNGMPACVRMPVMTLERPTMLATERSISSVMMMSVIGSAISRMGATSRSRYVTVSGLSKLRTDARATTITTSRMPMIAASRVSRMRRHSGFACAL